MLKDQQMSVAKGGRREDLGDQYFRSSWEANYARYLKFIDTQWEYEPKTFWFPIRSGTVNYTPDFYLPDEDVWIEVKGRLTSKCRTKLKRFKKYFFDEFKKLIVVIGDPFSKSKTNKSIMLFLVASLDLPHERIKSYREISKRFESIIPHWEI